MDDSTFSPEDVTLLKLGGSLITEKDRPYTPRLETLSRLAIEIANALQVNPHLQLILGHGAGSFAHVSADQHKTRQGVRTTAQWRGFSDVWWDAARLNHIVVKTLREAALSAISLPASASALAKGGDVFSWDLQPLKMALQAGLLPVIYGDVVFDILRGGTILSTEDLFMHLARQLLPDRLLLAGIEPGVWGDFPHKTSILSQITSENLPELADSLGGSNATDVTGGMRKKVEQSLELSQENPELEIMIFSGDDPGTLQEVLSGAHAGTIIRYH